jgi:hypothetical protein
MRNALYDVGLLAGAVPINVKVLRRRGLVTVRASEPAMKALLTVPALAKPS